MSNFYRILILIGIIISLSTVFLSVKKTENISLKYNGKITYENSSKEIKEKLASWRDYKNNSYLDTVKIYKKDYLSSIKFKQNINPRSWGELYKFLAENDRNGLYLITSMFNEIRLNNNLSPYEFADIVVSFVQHIPYSLLVRKSCEEASNNLTIKKMLSNGVICDEEVYAGIYSPLEFINNFKGDCDTRTVFLYSILSEFGYEVVILNSKLYSHSILGINLPSSGNFKKYQGKKYYTWETTSTGWKLGHIPPEYINLNYWDVVL
jgi:hypothetical protein